MKTTNKLVEEWAYKPDSQFRLECGEATAQEIRTTKSVLKSILRNSGDSNLEKLCRELLFLLNIQEESDSGNVFRPNRITSCRAADGERLNQILGEINNLVN